MTNNKTKFDLEERTGLFGEKILQYCQSVRLNAYNESSIKQLIRSATSVGANYMEANGSDSQRDFKNKISICKKEAKETTHWLRMIATLQSKDKERLRLFWQEAQELVLIFSAIIRKL